jgi:hypothetical protein
MRQRLFVGLAALAVLILPALSRADDKAPSLVLKIKSIDGLLHDFKYLGELAGKGEELKQADEMLKAFTNDQGLGGIDMKRPIGLYGSFSENPEQSPVVILLPIADEKAFLQFLGNFEIKPEKGDDGIYTVGNIPNVPIPLTLYFRFENKYAYITANDKANIDKKKLLAPSKVLADDDSVVSLRASLADLPDLIKQQALLQLENGLSALKEKKDDKEPPAVTKAKTQIAEHFAGRIKMILNEGEAVTLRLAVDAKKDDIVVDLSFKAKAGTALAKDMESAAKGQSLFAGLAGKDDAISANITATLPEDIKKALGPVVDDLIKQATEQEKDEVKKALAKAGLERLAPTLKAGEIDAGVSLRGPDSGGHYTAVAGVHVKDGKGLEGFLRDMVKNMPEKDREKITLDADSAGDAKIHKLVIDNMDAEGKAIFGSPTVYLAVRDDAVFVGLGPDGLAALKTATQAKAQSAKLLNVNVSVARVAGLDKKNAGAAKVAKEVFGNNPHGSDTVNVTAEMDQALKLRVTVKGKVFAFGVKQEEAKSK